MYPRYETYYPFVSQHPFLSAVCASYALNPLVDRGGGFQFPQPVGSTCAQVGSGGGGGWLRWEGGGVTFNWMGGGGYSNNCIGGEDISE